MTWTCKMPTAVKDTSGNSANINCTLNFTNDQSSEVQTRTFPINTGVAEDIVLFAQNIINSLNKRDALFPQLQAATDPSFIIAQG